MALPANSLSCDTELTRLEGEKGARESGRLGVNESIIRVNQREAAAG